MALFNLDNLRQGLYSNYIVESRSGENIDVYAERKLNEQTKHFSETTTYDIFLSHSIKDAVAVLRIKKILESKGLSVYVDWLIDKQFDRSKVTPDTAKTLRERLKNSKSLVLVLTSSSAQSSWVQWELGLGDGQKNGKVAILPLVTNNDKNPNFYRQEYLGLYPFIDEFSNTIFVNGKKVAFLTNWIKQTDPLKELIYS